MGLVRDLLNQELRIGQTAKEIIVGRIIDLYSSKVIQQNYENLIPEEIEIYDFSVDRPDEIKVRA
jgi:hypothetical protein